MKILPLASFVLLGLVVPVALPPDAHADKDPPPACLRWHAQTQARSVGYDHVVTLDNTCTRPAACVVSTDVAPDPIRVTVEAKQRIDLTTFRGSPSTAFTPRVDCKLQ